MDATQQDENQEPNVKLDIESTKPSQSQVTVVCRIKPLVTSQPQIEMKIDKDNAEIQITQARQETTKTFSFSKIYTDESQQQFVRQCCRPIIQNILQKRKGYLIFSYGVTNSGKTHTILGTQAEPGILPYLVKKLSDAHQVHISALELYNDEFFSLSTKKKIIPKEIGGFLDFRQCNISQIINAQNMDEKFKKYLANRTHNDTKINSKSSRSHAIFRLEVNDVVFGVVDLAGSERTNRVFADIDETMNINKSLLCLGRCIKALNENQNPPIPIPYRQSKLTRVLIEYFAARVQVLMIANISQAQEHFHENMKVLDYAIMAKDIRHCSTINSIMKSKSKKKIFKADIYQALSKSRKREVKIGQKSLKSSRKIFSNSLDQNQLENLRLENQKYARLIRKLELQQSLRRIQGSLSTYNYFQNLVEIQNEKSDAEKMDELKRYTYQSPFKKLSEVQYKDIGIGTSPIEQSQFDKEQQIKKIRQELQRIYKEQRIANMVHQSTQITESWKKKQQKQHEQQLSLKTPNKKGSGLIDNAQGQSFIKKSCKSIVESVKKILTGNLESFTTLKQVKSAKKSKTKSEQKIKKKQLCICSNTNSFSFEPEVKDIQQTQQKRKNFSFGESKIQRLEQGIQVDFTQIMNFARQNASKLSTETDQSNLEICEQVTELSIRNSTILEQKTNEEDFTDNDDETQKIFIENQEQLKPIKEQKKQKNKTKKTKAKKQMEKRTKRIAEVRKMAAQLCRQNSRTPIKRRLRNRK